MALVVADLIYPVGMLQKSWFAPPAEALEDAIVEWLDLAANLTAAVTDADLADAAMRHYVYARGYEAVADKIAGQPATQTGGTGGESRGWKIPDQINYWNGKAAAEWAAFHAVVDGETATSQAALLFDVASGTRGF